MNRIFSILALTIALGALSLSIYLMNTQKKMYFVENGKLYDGFTLKKEYENQIQKIRNSRRNMMDSLELTIKQFEAKKMVEEYQYAQEFYLEKAKKFEAEEDELLAEYNQQIWKRLNQYAIDYSKEKGIDLLLGASGNGTILHATEKLDVTNDLIQYANKRYSGK